MKKSFIFITIFILLFSFNKIKSYDYKEVSNNVEYLLNKRIKIINDFLYGTKDMKVLEKRLKEIENSKILANDLEILKKVIDNPTDYELTKNTTIVKVNKIEKKDNSLSLDIDLNWEISGYDGEYNVTKNYIVKCNEINGKLYIAELKYIK